jgi:hypothetical protein
MNVLNSVELKWTQSGNNGFFEVEIAKDPNFIEIVHTAYGITDTKYTWQNIEQGRKIFYWRVRNSGPGGISEFSEIWQFTTAVAAPMIVFPSSGSDQVMTYFTFKWESVEFADSYRLQVAKGYNIEPLLIDTIVKGTEFAVENFDKNKRYVWRIASIENEFQGLFGEIYHFFTRHPSDVSSSKPYLGINITIEPNPIKDLGHISIKSDYHFNGSLILFDINGKPILNFANLDINPGGISIPLYADKIPSGMYYLVLSTNNKRVYEKLYIVR